MKPAQFWRHVNVREPTECWEWTAYRHLGYGRVGINGRVHQAHRVAWELAHGRPIPKGRRSHDTCIMHVCDNPACCNPAHLRLGSQADNVADMNRKGRNGHAAKTHCPKGHAYSENNTYIVDGSRMCRECKRIKDRQRYYENHDVTKAKKAAAARRRRAERASIKEA